MDLFDCIGLLGCDDNGPKNFDLLKTGLVLIFFVLSLGLGLVFCEGALICASIIPLAGILQINAVLSETKQTKKAAS